jgi:hypothetical protein
MKKPQPEGAHFWRPRFGLGLAQVAGLLTFPHFPQGAAHALLGLAG